MQANECRAVWSHAHRDIVMPTQPLQRTGKRNYSTVRHEQQCGTLFAVAYTKTQLSKQVRGQIVTVSAVPTLPCSWLDCSSVLHSRFGSPS